MKKWHELTEEEKMSALGLIRLSYKTEEEFELLSAAAEELENPTWAGAPERPGDEW